MPTPLDLSTRPGADGMPVLTVTGEIDMSNAQRFREALGEAAPGGGRFVVDLTGVAYLDSAGVNVLFDFESRVRLIAGTLLAPVLTISGLAAEIV